MNDYFERIEKAVNFIEDNLKEKLTVETIAAHVCFSKFHFIRVFSKITGETVGQYLRRRRISRSSWQLIHTDHSILRIALEYQFESQEAYTRSFKAIYFTTPGKYRKLKNNQIAYGRSKLTTERLEHLRSNITMQPRITEIQSKKLVGKGIMTSLANNRIPQLWGSFIPLMNKIDNNKNTGCYEISPFNPEFKMENFTKEMEFEKLAAIEVSDFKQIPEGLQQLTIEGGLYAVFEHKGSMQNIQMSFDYSYGTWLLNSPYILDKRTSFERYGVNYLGPEHPESITELWIPIKNKP